jgi:hypothetical protein
VQILVVVASTLVNNLEMRGLDQGSMSTAIEHGAVVPKPAVKAVRYAVMRDGIERKREETNTVSCT